MIPSLANAVPRWGNVLAPQWMGLSPLMSHYTDVDAVLTLPVAIAAASVLEGSNALVLQIDTDADCLCREFQWMYIGTNAGVVATDLRFRIRDTDGSLVTLEYCDMIDLLGSLPPLYLRRGSQLIFEVQNVGAADITGQFILKCVKRTLCENPAAIVQDFKPVFKRYAAAPAGFHHEFYRLYFELTLSNGTPIYQLPILNDPDAEFRWRGLAGNGAALSTQLRLYDSNNVPLFSDFTEYEAVASRHAGSSAPLWPEVVIPASGVVYIDLRLAPGAGAPQVVKLAMVGVKRYQDVC